jgi:hypothetical protein
MILFSFDPRKIIIKINPQKRGPPHKEVYKEDLIRGGTLEN